MQEKNEKKKETYSVVVNDDCSSSSGDDDDDFILVISYSNMCIKFETFCKLLNNSSFSRLIKFKKNNGDGFIIFFLFKKKISLN